MASYNDQINGNIDLSSEFCNLWDELCMNEEHSDVTLIIENAEIPAHKTILSARSKYFVALFNDDFAEKTKPKVKLEGPLDVFKVILRFIYTGYMSLDTLNVEQIIDVYGLAESYNFKTLKETISKYLTAKLSVDDCVEILNATCLYSVDDLQKACLTFMDCRSAEILQHDSFKSLSLNSLCTLLKRDTFYAPEIDIFNALKDWININSNADSKTPLSLVRWSSISVDDFMDVVLPSNVLDQTELIDVVKKNRENKIYRIPSSSVEYLGENFASAKYNAETISGENASALLDGNFTEYSLHEGFTYHAINSSSRKHNSIIVRLGKIYMINYIEMLLMDMDDRSYSYSIDVSLDGAQYKRLIDCNANYYRSWQFVHFPSRPVKYIKVVGTRALNTPTNYKYVTYADGRKQQDSLTTFDVVGFKAMYIEGRDTVIYKEPNYLRPTKNVADPKIGAIVLEGAGDMNILNNDLNEFTCHEKGHGQILLQLNQPYYISSMRMLLGCDKSHSNQYSFYIETSLNKSNWQIAVDKRNESLSGWQQFEFEERPVVFIKIIGTQSDVNFICTYFECPSTSRKPILRRSQSDVLLSPLI